MRRWIIMAMIWGLIPPCFAQEQDIFAFVRIGQVEKVREALKADPKLANAVDRAGRTPLFLAVSSGNLDMVRLLVEYGAAVRVGDNNLRAPIHFANWAGNKAMIDLLLEKGAVVDTRAIGGATPLIHASLNDQFEMSRFLIERGADINVQCNSLTTPLYFAVLNDNKSYYEYLLQAGAEVDTPDFLDRTPLAVAVRDGNAFMVQSLIQNGADPGRKDPATGRSLIHLAAIEGHADVLEILLQAGLKADEKDRAGLTALDYALRHGHVTAARILREKGGADGKVSTANPATLLKLKTGEAEVIKLQNRSWGISTPGAFLVFGYSETGNAPPEKSLANGHLTVDALSEIAGSRRITYIDREIHAAGRPFSLEGFNPVYAFQKDVPGISFVLNPAYDRFYAGLGLKNTHFPRADAPATLDGLKASVFPSYGAHAAIVLEVDGLTIVWLTGICDNYLVRRRDAGVIDRLKNLGVRPDILLLGTPSGIGPEYAHGMREAYLESAKLEPRAVFCFGHEPLERKVRLQLSRKNADISRLSTADDPGNRFIILREKKQ